MDDGAKIKGGQVIDQAMNSGIKQKSSRSRSTILHATVLHLLGMDHKKLTYRYNGRDMRLTDVYGEINSSDCECLKSVNGQ